MTEQTLVRRGRPDKINKAYVDRANEWLDKRLWEQDNRVVPTVEGLARYLGIARVQMYEAPELKYTLERLQTLQSEMVISGGLDNTFNASIAKLILSAKHGYVERSQQDITSNGETIGQVDPTVAANFAEWAKAQAVEGEVVAQSTLDDPNTSTDTDRTNS